MVRLKPLLLFLPTLFALDDSCVDYGLEVGPTGNYRITSESETSEDIFVVVVFDPNPDSPLALHDDGYVTFTFDDGLPENLDSVFGFYPIDGEIILDEKELHFNLNDASSGSMIIAFQLSAQYSSERIGNLIPDGIWYCRGDPSQVATEQPTTDEPLSTTSGEAFTSSPISCLQDRLNDFCQNLVKPGICENFQYARFNTEKGRWRCYDHVSQSVSKKSCVDEAGSRIFCSSYTDNSQFCNVEVSEILNEGCAEETTEGAEESTSAAPTTTPALCDAPACLDASRFITISESWSAANCDPGLCFVLESTMWQPSDQSEITIVFDDAVEFPDNLPYPIESVQMQDVNTWNVRFQSFNQNPASFNINLKGAATQVTSAEFCTCQDDVFTTTEEQTFTTTTTEEPNPFWNATSADAECHVLSGFTYEIVAKWNKGEQIKITTTFDEDVESPLAIRDESFIRLSFDDDIDADVFAYWPLEQDDARLEGANVELDLNDQVAGYDIAILEFQLRFSEDVEENVQLSTIELCHRISPTVPSSTNSTPVTSSDYCEDVTLTLGNTWTRGRVEISFEPTPIDDEYYGGDYVEVGFSHPISIPDANALYHPFTGSPGMVEDLGNNAYRFFMKNGFDGWKDNIPEFQTFGQFGFVGSTNHVPEVLWSQVCHQEAIEETTEEPPATAEVTPDEYCDELIGEVTRSWEGNDGVALLDFRVNKGSLSNQYEDTDHIEIGFGAKILSFKAIYWPLDANSGTDLGGNRWRFGFVDGFTNANEWTQRDIGQATWDGDGNGTPPQIDFVRICLGEGHPDATTTEVATTEKVTTVEVTTDEITTVDPNLLTDAEFCEPIAFEIENAWMARGMLQIKLLGNAIENAYAADDYVEIGFSKAVSPVSLYYPFDGSLATSLGSGYYRLDFLDGFSGYTDVVQPQSVGQLSFDGDAGDAPAIIFAQICDASKVNPPTTTEEATTEEATTEEVTQGTTIAPPTDDELCEEVEVAIENAWHRGHMQLEIVPSAIERSYAPGDYLEIDFGAKVEVQALYHPFGGSRNLVEFWPERTTHLGNNVWQFTLLEDFEGWSDNVPEKTIGQFIFEGSTTPEILRSRLCKPTIEETTTEEKETTKTTTTEFTTVETTWGPTVEPETGDEFCESVDTGVVTTWFEEGNGHVQFQFNESVIADSYKKTDFFEISLNRPTQIKELYWPFTIDGALYLGAGSWRLFFLEDFEGYTEGLVGESTFGAFTFEGEPSGDNNPVVISARLCSTAEDTTAIETTTEEPTTTTTEEVCPCTDDVTGQIFNGFTPFFAKFGQIKGYASGANTFAFAMAQTIHDAEKNPGMPAGGHDGYIVIRKYNSCDHTVMEKFADPSVTWEMTDFTCGDCYTSHQGGYFKDDVANKKKTFTLGYSFNNDGTDTNKASQVDKYLLMVTGLQALGVTEQQAFDCLAGAKPANMYGDFMEEGCDYSHCVGEKVLIW